MTLGINGIRAGITRALAPRTVPKIRVGGIGDAHANKKWVEWADRLSSQCDYMVSLGDLIDRGHNNQAVVDKAMALHERGRLIPLWGNHELLFTQAMFEDEWALATWIENGGNSTIAEFRVPMYKRILSAIIGFDPKQQRILDRYAMWMTENFKLFHIDELGAMYIHTGIPLDEQGELDISYAGFQGLEALKKAENDIREAFRTRDMQHPVFYFLNSSNDSFMWQRSWLERMISNGTSKKVVDALGVNMIVFGHLSSRGIINIDNRVWGIDARMHKGEGCIFVNTPGHVIIESFHDGRSVINKP